MSLKKKSGKKVKLPVFSMNITSLMDVLTVLLFFLVKSFSVSTTSVQIPEDMRLPSSVSEDKFEEGISVVLSKDVLMFDNQVIAKLENGRFRSSDIGSDQRTIVPLKKILEKEYSKRSGIMKSADNAAVLPPGKIIIQSDKRLTFGTLKYLLHTASHTNYNDMQFVVMNED